MSIPSLPPFYNMIYTDTEGRMTTESQFYNDQLHQVLDTMVNFFKNGIPFPLKTTAEITALETSALIGTVWFNTTIAKLQVKTADGVVETITSS